MGDFRGLELELNRTPGARAVRVVHPSGQGIGEHSHDWACLTLQVVGGYLEVFEGRGVAITGPSAVLHPPGGLHANRIGDDGLETVSIQFDPAWLADAVESRWFDRPRTWAGGSTGAAARALAAAWSRPGGKAADLAKATSKFLRLATDRPPPAPAPAWLARVEWTLAADPAVDVVSLAADIGMTPLQMSRRFRTVAGEGLRESVRRRRLARASVLLRATDTPLAEIALAAGYCDQAHMNREFRAIAGRTPLAVRNERERLGVYKTAP